MHTLPEIGFLRLAQIIGDPDAATPIPAIIPVSKSAWWAGVESGLYPKPVKFNGVTCWRVEHIRALITNATSEGWENSPHRLPKRKRTTAAA